jgi:uncharacterized protein (UPF0332 family)
VTHENRRLALLAEWERAHEALAAAEILLAAGQPVSTVSRAYYAAFHAARALLFSRGLEPLTHRGVRAQLGLHVVRAGLLAPELAEALSRASSLREDADYGGAAVITAATAERACAEARDWLAATQALLEREGWLPARLP